MRGVMSKTGHKTRCLCLIRVVDGWYCKGSLWGNLQTATKDAWSVFQEAMEAEGTYQSMGKSVEEITNLRQSFMQKFFDVRAER